MKGNFFNEKGYTKFLYLNIEWDISFIKNISRYESNNSIFLRFIENIFDLLNDKKQK